MTERSAFLDAITHIDHLFTTDSAAARRAFPAALALATPEDRAFLTGLADTFTRYPFQIAHRRLEAVWKAHPEHRDRISVCAPDTDPGLHHRQLLGLFEVSFAAAELPPLPVRDRYRPLVTRRAPTHRVDAARLAPARIAARVAARTVRVGDHRGPVLTRARLCDALVTDYAQTLLFTDLGATDDEHEDDPLATVSVAPVAPGMRVRSADQPRDSEAAAQMWDRVYVAYVAAQYDDELRAAWDEQRWRAAERADRDSAEASLAQRARAYLDAAEPSNLLPRRSAPRTPRRRSRISEEERFAFAAARTTLRVRDDDRPEIPDQGNGLDYDRAAMVAVTGWWCVSCFIERATSDQRAIHTRSGRLVSDDGLCDLCRADGRPGIPPLPENFTLEQFVLSRCEYLAAAYPRAAHGLLKEVWHRAAPHPICRIISRYLHQHPELGPAPSPAASRRAAAPSVRRTSRPRRPQLAADQRHGRCDGCTHLTVIHIDGYCTTCRVDLGLIPARRAQPRAA
ncbi:hypothetical protein IU450_28520 [Nocardia abscessus]|uniref:hypothetical protein n=1 Tax=Nocardia abscessus TaxID=120957 RepID=UPI0018951257|nr:hypothetical protein [Nocardia abscessus]MBF6339805.1 hypothetical protein [Nocardia abscessus]